MNVAFARPVRIVLALTLIGVLSPLGRVTAQSSDGEPLRSLLDRRVPELLRRYAVPGAAVALIEDGRSTWSSSYGEGVDDESVFQVASISKTVTAWGVMNLLETSGLSLDTPILDHVSWEPPPSRFDEDGVTIRRALSHTAGLSVRGVSGVERRSELVSTKAALEGEGENPAVELIYEPGREWRYSGGGYGVLQLFLEETYDEPFAEVMRKRVLDPLEMKDSSFDPPARLTRRLPVARTFRGEVAPPYQYDLKAAAGLNTTASDLAKFVAATIDGHEQRVVSASGVRRMLRSAPNTGGLFSPFARGGYGLGYATEPLAGGKMLATHTGSNVGWASLFALVPEERAGLVVLTNSDTGLLLYADVLCDWLPSVAGTQSSLCRSLSGIRTATIVVWLLVAVSMLGLAWFVAKRGERRPRKSKRGIALGALIGLGAAIWVFVWHLFSLGGLRIGSVVSPQFVWVTVAVVAGAIAFLMSVVRSAVPIRKLLLPGSLAALVLWILALHTDLLGRAVIGRSGLVPANSLSLVGWLVTAVLAVLAAATFARREGKRPAGA